MKRIYSILIGVICLSILFSACCKKQVKKTQPVPQTKKVEKTQPVEKPAPVVKEEPKPQPKEEVTAKPVQETPALPTYHEVKKGECLWKIAEYKDIYNDPFMWPLIYRANKEKIKDPDLIFPKQVFRIPRDYTESQKQDAIHFAKTRGPWSLWDGK